MSKAGIQTSVSVAGTVDIWRIDFVSAERLDCSRVDVDICSSDRVQNGAGIVRGVNLRRVAVG